MLRITISRSSEAASSYFKEGLSKEGNYYLDKETISSWHGATARKLNLERQQVKKKTFPI